MILALLAVATLQSAPEMISRKEWGAADPVLPMKAHERKYLTVHHTGVLAKRDMPTAQKLKNLQLFSQREDKLASGKTKPVWADVPYHYYIGWDGKIAVGRDDGFVGDTNTEYDPTGHVLVVVDGEFGQEEPNEAEIASLKKLLVYLAVKYNIASSDIKTHKDYSKQTTCPGKALYSQMDDLRRYVRDNRYRR